MCIDPILGWDQYQECEILGAFYSAPKIPEISVRNQMEHTDFGLVRPEYLGTPLKVVHFDRSGHFGRLDWNVPFHLTKLLFPVLLFCFLLIRTIPRRTVAWVWSVYLECTVPLGTWSFQNFKPDFLLNKKRFPLSHFAHSCCHCHHPSLQ